MPNPFSDDELQRVINETFAGQPADDPAAAQPPAAGPTPTPAKKKGVGFLPYLALGLGGAADIATTAGAFGRGAREVNPLMIGKSLPAVAAQKALTSAGIAFLMHRLAQSGHPTAAKAMGYENGAIGGGLALYNNSVGR